MVKTTLKRIGLGALIVVFLLGTGGIYYFKSYLPNTVAPKSFPQVDGQIQLEGLDGTVDIYRDSMGVPHIYATTPHDLFFSQGFVHAQDRFWQMDFWRHVGSGTISEMFSSEVETDAFLRTLGWRVTAEQEWEQLSPELKSNLTAYTSGVNAYLQDHEATALSLEYTILGLLSPDYKIEPWTPVNSLTWGKAMAWDLRGNMDEEIERAVLLKTLKPEQVGALFPPYPQDHPVIVNKIGNGSSANAAPQPLAFNIPEKTLATLGYNTSLLDVALGPITDGIGSNSWAVSGSRTTTGLPLLANDPHLSIQMPSIWYQVHLECKPITEECPYNVAGFTFAGVPGVIIGHNDKIAWGFTNVGPDVMDLYVERVNPDNPNQYEVNGEWVDFDTRQETINVAGSDPVEITVRLTRHGPVISETYGDLKNENTSDDPEFVPFRERVGIALPEQYVISLKWTALSPSTPFEAVWGFNQAQNWENFREAAKHFHVPAQNLLYADIEGNIGYQMPGDIPIRANGDGTFPVPGWTDEYEWTSFIPFEELPYTFNPPEGYIVTANNQVPPTDYPYLITKDWNYGFRAQRIVDMVENAPGKIDLAYMQKIQGDSFDANGPVFVPLLTQINFESGTPNQAAALDLLKNWDFEARADSAAAAAFEAFWRHLLQNTCDDDMPELYWPEGGSRYGEFMRNLSVDSGWWDDKGTPDVVETREDILKKSFADGIAELEKLLGNEPAKWTWGELHTATFRNGTLGKSGLPPIEALFNRGAFPTGGGSSIINATAWDATEGYQVVDVPSMRMIVDLSNLNNSVTVHTTGQSGHAYHPHYSDMSELWADVKYYSMMWDQNEIMAGAEGHLVLSPK
ncbi:MAG TPA: penicillin acylase family protein [Anaerolineales bacterium]|nr:penicillin acylase family protein [Anaerolineales bacterium]